MNILGMHYITSSIFKSGTFNNEKQNRKASVFSNNHIPHSVLSCPCYPGEFWSNICLTEQHDYLVVDTNFLQSSRVYVLKLKKKKKSHTKLPILILNYSPGYLLLDIVSHVIELTSLLVPDTTMFSFQGRKQMKGCQLT